jgi:hypothetical protein
MMGMEGNIGVPPIGPIKRGPKFIDMAKGEEMVAKEEAEKMKGKQLEIKFTSLDQVPNAADRVNFFSFVHNEDSGQPLTVPQFKEVLEKKYGPLFDRVRQGHLHQVANKLNKAFGKIFPGWEATVEGKNTFSVNIHNLQELLARYVEPVCGTDGKLLPKTANREEQRKVA